MSVNNLGQQLSWLLATKPFIPPPLTACHAQAPETGAILSQGSDCASRYTLDQESSTLTTTNNTAPPVVDEPHQPAPDMARLRAPPSPAKKPRLVAQNSCPTPAVSSTARNTTSVTSGNDKRGKSDAFLSRFPPTQDFHADPNGVASEQRNRIADTNAKAVVTPAQRADRIDTVDLTGGWSSASRSGQNSHASKRNVTSDNQIGPSVARLSKKRKSDEYELDLQSPSSYRKNQTKVANLAMDSSEFHNIDDLVDVAPRDRDDPPPPYSTNAPTRVTPGRTAVHGNCEPSDVVSVAEGQSYENYEAYFSQSSTNEDLKNPGTGLQSPEELSRAGGPTARPERQEKTNILDDIIPAEHSNIGHTHLQAPETENAKLGETCEGNPTADRLSNNATSNSHSRPSLATSTAVIDSEDEEMFDSLQTQSDINDQRQGVEEDERRDDKLLVKVGQSSQLPVEVALQNCETSDQQMVDFNLENGDVDPPPFQPSTTKSSIPSNDRPNSRDKEQISTHASENDESLVVSNNSDELVKSFSSWTRSDLLSLAEHYSKAWSQAHDNYLDAIAEDHDDISALKETRQRCKVRRDALHNLIEARAEYSRLTRTKEDLKRHIGEDEDRELDPEMRVKLRDATRTWRTEESKLKLLIRAAEIEGLSDTVAIQDTLQVNVKSTQIPTDLATATPGTHDYTFHDTQRIQQTQTRQWNISGALDLVDRKCEVPPIHFNTVPKAQTTQGKPQIQTLPLPRSVVTRAPESGFYGDDDRLFTNHMGTPPPVARQDDVDFDEFEDFDDEDDEALLAEVEFPQAGPKNSLHVSRPVFTERSNNIPGTPGSHSKSKTTNISANIPELQHRWSQEVIAAMKHRFHLRGFRPNQLDAINATLGGKDAFVLMPTGGGKSLCYQLPSIVRSGTTKGVTIVVSPLLSLMEDQTAHLEKLKIQAFVLNGETPQDRKTLVYNALKDQRVEDLIQLLYVTPEMLSKNKVMVDALERLHSRNKLARVVIDEAHCVSQWGHDFRPDYKSLGELREAFGGVPFMALTATATENVKVDVIHNLSMQGCKVFTQSFNRPNLIYEVIPKGKGFDIVGDMADKIKTRYRNQCGIIYCLARQRCEDVAEELRNKHGIAAQHYHAQVDPDEKRQIQQNWQSGVFHIIVATIAFGMGIDKPDVRFVMHHSIPKSLEGYYQETGRAGRDGKRSGCYLYYGYQDTATLKKFIEKSEASAEQKERQYGMIRNVVQYCENKADCRRAQVLAYFGETFGKENCNGTCDNCTSTSTFAIQDLTHHAQNAIQLVQQIYKQKVTLLQCVDIMRGLKSNRKVTKSKWHQLDQFGSASELDRNDIERLFHRLMKEGALEEENKVNAKGFALQYVKLGTNYQEFRRGRRSIKIQTMIGSGTNANETKSAAVERTSKESAATGRQPLPVSTNVSSPVEAEASRKISNHRGNQPEINANSRTLSKTTVHGYDPDDDFCVSDDDDFEDAFEQIRDPKRVRTSKEPKLSDPIIGQGDLEEYNEKQLAIIEDFVNEARQECKKIQQLKNLRTLPFTDTLLRRMAMYWSKDKYEMSQIEGIRKEAVKAHGDKFLKLLRKHEKNYLLLQDEEYRPNDPNHHNVIDLVDDDEDESEYEAAGATHRNTGIMGDASSSPAESSAYFTQNAHVAQFNAQWDKAAKDGGTWNGKKSTRGGSNSKFNNSRGASAGPKKSPAKKSTNARGRSKTAARGRNRSASAPRTNARGGIGMMPT